MNKGSSLNPLANTFIPSTMTRVDVEMLNSDSEAFTTKSISLTTVAVKCFETVIKTKKKRGEDHITKYELMPIILDLISHRYNLRSRYDWKRAQAYLHEKLPSEPLNIEGNGKSPIPWKTYPRIYDFSSYKEPAKTFLLVAFYGLNRHEQAFRPLLSLAHRPRVLEDKVWSLTDEDLKLWNPSIVEPCGCPPMFGYHIPTDFFGNPFNLRNPCPKKQAHLCRSKESLKGNDFILLERARNYQVEETAFVDFKEKLDSDSESVLDYYSKQMKEIVNSVYSIIDDFDTAENTTSNVIEDTIDEGYVSNTSESLWNTKNSEPITPMSDQFNEDDHPLLNAQLLNTKLNDEEPYEEVPIEIKELLRRSFSSELDAEVATNSCDPPCSVWCCKEEISSSIRNGRNSDSSAIDLLNETTKFLTDISCPETIRPARQPKPSFKRSFSANDSDFCNNYTCSMSSLKLNPIDYKIRRGSNDSGIMSSQEEDVFGEESEETSDKAPMWTLFSGEHSLWKPLPLTEQTKSTQKRARDLKRQTSSVN